MAPAICVSSGLERDAERESLRKDDVCVRGRGRVCVFVRGTHFAAAGQVAQQPHYKRQQHASCLV